MAEFWGGLKSNQRRSQRLYGRWGLTKTQLRGFFLILSSFFFMTGLVPEPNPSQQRVRERAEEGKKIFLARSGRSSCAPFPGSRALCEVGLAACFFIFGSFLVLAI